MTSTSAKRSAASKARSSGSCGRLIRSCRPGRRFRSPVTRTGPALPEIVSALIDGFTPLAGDRSFGEDLAIVGGLGRFRGNSVVVIGTEKGINTEDRVKRNFGMARPEGYRKAKRLMELADRFAIPVLTFVDTAGAYPGVGAEQRGQAEAIAKSIETSLRLRVPIVASIVGEGGSGGAVALATADRVLMFEHSIYSVISPEGCASILWRSGDHAKDAADALRMTAQDLEKLGVIDQIVPEPLGRPTGTRTGPSRTLVTRSRKRCVRSSARTVAGSGTPGVRNSSPWATRASPDPFSGPSPVL